MYVCVCADFLGKQLEDYVAQLEVPTHVVRMGERKGLIRARLKGTSLTHAVHAHTRMQGSCISLLFVLLPVLYGLCR